MGGSGAGDQEPNKNSYRMLFRFCGAKAPHLGFGRGRSRAKQEPRPPAETRTADEHGYGRSRLSVRGRAVWVEANEAKPSREASVMQSRGRLYLRPRRAFCGNNLIRASTRPAIIAKSSWLRMFLLVLK